MKYKDLNDYELMEYVRDNNSEAHEIMFEKYKPLIEQSARRLLKYCKYSGLEFNDLVQEGMLGLNYAINGFSDNKEASFFTYAKMCIERRQISAVISSQRQKHRFLNESIPFEAYNSENELAEVDRLLADNSYNPESVMFDCESSNELAASMKELLTDFEQQVFDLKVSGFSYIEIAEIMDKDKKAIDNAIQRIKNKLKSIVI